MGFNAIPEFAFNFFIFSLAVVEWGFLSENLQETKLA